MIGARIGSRIGARLAAALGAGADPIGSSGSGVSIALLWFDSNGICKGTNATNSTIVKEFNVDVAFPGVTLNSQIADTGGATPTYPLTFTQFGPTSLIAYNPGASQGFGPEVPIGRALNAISSSFTYVVKCAVTASELHSHWLPTSTSVQGDGKNLYATQRDRARALEASTGGTVKVIYLDLGANDSVNTTPANAMQTNMGAMVAQLHADFPSAVIVWPLLTLATATTFVATVRTKMLAYASTAPSYFMMPNLDDSQLSDASHWNNRAVLTVGPRLGDAARELLGIAPATAGPAPDIVGNGVTFATNALTLLADAAGGTRDGDLELAFCCVSGATPGGGAALQTISDPAGWTIETGGQTTGGGITGTWRVWSRQVAAGEIAADSVPPSRDRRPPQASVTIVNAVENIFKRITIRGPTPFTLAVEAKISDSYNTALSTGPKTMSAVTTGGPNRLIVYFTGGLFFSANGVITITAAGVTGLTKFCETYHSMPDTGQPVHSIWKATKATLGSTLTASQTSTLNNLQISSVLAISP